MKLGKNRRIGGGGDPWHYEMRAALGGSRPRRLTASLLTRGTAPEGPVNMTLSPPSVGLLLVHENYAQFFHLP